MLCFRVVKENRYRGRPLKTPCPKIDLNREWDNLKVFRVEDRVKAILITHFQVRWNDPSQQSDMKLT